MPTQERTRVGRFLSNNQGQLIGGGLSMLGGFIGAGNQHRRQRELMNMQHRNQMELNRQGHDLQMDMWNRTNYGAQVQHMKDAGLNIGLMYGQGGGGGSTTAGSQSGGSAASGQAAAWNPMDVSQMMLVNAQKDKIVQETKKLEKEVEGIDSQIGVNKQSIKESIERVKNISADTKLKAEQKLASISERKLADAKTEFERRRNEYGLTGNTIIDGTKALGLDVMNNDADATLFKVLMGTWFGAKVVNQVVEIITDMSGKQIIKSGKKFLD